MRLVRAEVSPQWGAPPTRVKFGGVGGALQSSSSSGLVWLELIGVPHLWSTATVAEEVVTVEAPMHG